MRIAIDARELRGAPTGVGRYLGEILTAWTQLPEAAIHDYIVCAPDTPALPDLSRLRVSTLTHPGDGTLWEQWALPRLVRDARADVLLAPGYTGPLRCPVPMVLAIHDVSFAAHPEWFSWREGARRRTVTRLAAARAARILTISEFSKREIEAYLGIAPQTIEVIYPGVTRLPSEGPALLARPGSPKDAGAGVPTILFVGSIFNRRHVPELIEGFGRLARTHGDVRLEIVGDNRTAPHLDLAEISAAAGAGDRIRVRSYIPDEELGSLYARARAFVFLSDYEGFGLTPLEALAAGIPAVILDTAVARETCGDAALYVGTPEPSLIEAALERVLFDDGERTRQAAAAGPVLARYSWTSCARRVLEQLEACATIPDGTTRGSRDRVNPTA